MLKNDWVNFKLNKNNNSSEIDKSLIDATLLKVPDLNTKIAFVVEESSMISAEQFKKVTNFIADYINIFNLSPKNFAFIPYDSSKFTVINFGQEDFISKIQIY